VRVSRIAERGARWPWLWIAAAWAAVGLIEASQTVLVMRAEGRKAPWLPLFSTELAIWIPWALATPWIVALARRHPVVQVVRGPRLRTFALHAMAFALVSVFTEAWSAALQVVFNPWGNRTWPTFADTFRTTLVFQAFMFLVVYALILTVTSLADARERIARQAAESARLAEQLATAQLAALRGQMDPHFMYNTLNAIAGLVRDRRSDETLSMIVGLSEFLRRASEDSHRSQVTLGEEVDYLRRYLQIQQVRFGDRLRVSLDVPAELLGAQVPNLLLQPLAENAIKHGIARRVAGGTLSVSAVREGGDLVLTIRNDGPPHEDEPAETPAGVGLANLRTRLNILHGDRSSLRLRPLGAEGTEVRVTLPYLEV
jgi:two-component sensor histidine kinase